MARLCYSNSGLGEFRTYSRVLFVKKDLFISGRVPQMSGCRSVGSLSWPRYAAVDLSPASLDAAFQPERK